MNMSNTQHLTVTSTEDTTTTLIQDDRSVRPEAGGIKENSWSVKLRQAQNHQPLGSQSTLS
jgi:hypothetical protein